MGNGTEHALNIGFVSTRFKGLDGVSLEAAKWAEVLENEFGYNNFWFAGELDKDEKVSMLVEEAYFGDPETKVRQQEFFGRRTRSRELTNWIQKRKEFLKDKLYRFIEKFKIDLLIPQNTLAIPMHIPLGLALTELIAETGIPTIAHHHDFFWERPRFLINSVQDLIQQAFPPDLPTIKHVVINSMAQKELAARRGIASNVIYNVIDFDEQRAYFDDFNCDFRKDFGFSDKDILILQPTRVVSRKGIEQALYLVKRLNMPEVKFIISHSPGDEGYEYFEWIKDTAEKDNIPLYFIYNKLHENRHYENDGSKIYSLWDVYPHVDFITYPSLYEGFGNAFLEAIYFRKPLIVNRYSVYIVDIEPKGFRTVTIDGFLNKEAVEETREILLNPHLRTEMVEKNYQLGKQFFSYTYLKKELQTLLSSFYGTLSSERNPNARDYELYHMEGSDYY
ncbi:MAG: glycosyltransferase family 4 protein [Spirochaetales bacterium]|nr:glycosyltransferase family 4 protein [Spirochaetales bacterium]MCF7937839.1 glycosyltransferase family 4 protein [Spirochaetales bacterium]